MSELLAAIALLSAVLLAAWFFNLLFQNLEDHGYKIGYTQGVIDGANRALNPENKREQFVNVSIVEDPNE